MPSHRSCLNGWLQPTYGKKEIDLEPAMVFFFSVHLNDFNEPLGMYWQCLYHFDKVLPFGLRAARYKFSTFYLMPLNKF